MSGKIFVRVISLSFLMLLLGTSCRTDSSFYLTQDEIDSATCEAMLIRFGRNSEAQELTGEQADKVVICHVPPGNPEAKHTITVGKPALQAHLGHGHEGQGVRDYLGPCIDDEEQAGSQPPPPPPTPPLPPGSLPGPDEEEDVVDACLSL